MYFEWEEVMLKACAHILLLWCQICVKMLRCNKVGPSAFLQKFFGVSEGFWLWKRCGLFLSSGHDPCDLFKVWLTCAQSGVWRWGVSADRHRLTSIHFKWHIHLNSSDLVKVWLTRVTVGCVEISSCSQTLMNTNSFHGWSDQTHTLKSVEENRWRCFCFSHCSSHILKVIHHNIQQNLKNM